MDSGQSAPSFLLLFKCLQWLPWFLLFINPYCQWQCCPRLTASQLNLFSVTMQAVDSDFNILRRWRNYSDANSDSSICSQMMMKKKKKKSLLHMVSNVQTCISVRQTILEHKIMFQHSSSKYYGFIKPQKPLNALLKTFITPHQRPDSCSKQVWIFQWEIRARLSNSECEH